MLLLVTQRGASCGAERFPTSCQDADGCVSVPSTDSGSLPGLWEWEGYLPPSPIGLRLWLLIREGRGK